MHFPLSAIPHYFLRAAACRLRPSPVSFSLSAIPHPFLRTAACCLRPSPVPFPAFSLPPYPDFRDMPFLRIRYPSFPALRAAPPLAPHALLTPFITHTCTSRTAATFAPRTSYPASRGQIGTMPQAHAPGGRPLVRSPVSAFGLSEDCRYLCLRTKIRSDENERSIAGSVKPAPFENNPFQV